MDYKEFRSAAHRHLLSCQNMCKALASINNLEEKNALLADIYYLSGYIIETLLSYAFFCSCDKKTRKKAVEDHPEYNNGFKTHDFQAKISFVIKHNCSLDGMIFVSEKHPNKKYMDLFNKWHVELRYRSISNAGFRFTIDEQLIKGYIGSLKDLETQINRKYN